MTPIITGANTELPAFNRVIEKTFTRNYGCPLRRDRDTLHKELEHVLVDISVRGFDWSVHYGLLAEARSASNYKTTTNPTYFDPGFIEPPMTEPSIKEATSDFEREKNKA